VGKLRTKKNERDENDNFALVIGQEVVLSLRKNIKRVKVTIVRQDRFMEGDQFL